MKLMKCHTRPCSDSYECSTKPVWEPGFWSLWLTFPNVAARIVMTNVTRKISWNSVATNAGHYFEGLFVSHIKMFYLKFRLFYFIASFILDTLKVDIKAFCLTFAFWHPHAGLFSHGGHLFAWLFFFELLAVRMVGLAEFHFFVLCWLSQLLKASNSESSSKHAYVTRLMSDRVLFSAPCAPCYYAADGCRPAGVSCKLLPPVCNTFTCLIALQGGGSRGPTHSKIAVFLA